MLIVYICSIEIFPSHFEHIIYIQRTGHPYLFFLPKRKKINEEEDENRGSSLQSLVNISISVHRTIRFERENVSKKNIHRKRYHLLMHYLLDARGSDRV